MRQTARSKKQVTALGTRSLTLFVFLFFMAAMNLACFNWAAAGGFTFETEWGGFGTTPGYFNDPFDMAVNPDGTVFVADRSNARVQAFDPDGNFMYTWGSLGNSAGKLYGPTGIFAFGPDGSVFVADSSNSRIQKFDFQGNFLLQWGSYGVSFGCFINPWDIAVDSTGMVYVCDSGNQRVQKFDGQGNFILSWGSKGYSTNQFQKPSVICVGPDDTVFVADETQRKVQRFSSEGAFIASWGSYGTTPGYFVTITGMAVTPAGRVHVVDPGVKIVSVFDMDGRFIERWGKAGASFGQFTQPWAIATAPSGAVYVSDKTRHRVMKFRASAPPLTVKIAEDPTNFTPFLGSQVIFAGDALVFSAEVPSEHEGIADFSWNFGDGCEDWGANVAHTFENGQTFEIVVTAVSGTEKATDVVSVRVISLVEAVQMISDFVTGLELQRGMEKSLVNSLDSLAGLVSSGRYAPASNRIGALVNHLTAQCGKKISTSDYDTIFSALGAIDSRL